MKRAICIFMAAMLAFSLTACGQSGTAPSGGSPTPAGSEIPASTPKSPDFSPEASQPEQAAPGSVEEPSRSDAESAAEATAPSQPDTEKKTLVAYFSWSPSGNTRTMAAYIQEQTGGDLLEIEPATPYPTDYSQCADAAKVERDNNERPAILNPPASMEEYDTILIGYPIWWHTAPMIIGTFLESYDLTGVEIYPFSQSDSMNVEQFDNSMDFIREAAKDATVHDGLFEEEQKTDLIYKYLEQNDLVTE